MLPTRFLSYAFCTIFSHCAMSACSPTHCPGYVELIYGAWYRLIGETCSKINCEVAPSFPAGVSRVCFRGASTWFLCVTFYVCLQSLCKKSLTFHKKPEKVTQNLAHKLIQGSSECFHVLFILIWAVLNKFCVICAKVLGKHMKYHRTTIIYWRQ